MYRRDLFDEKEQLKDLFRHHAPTGDKGDRHAEVRAACLTAAAELAALCPASDELQIAIAKLREAMMWANSAIALHPEPGKKTG